MSWNWSWKRVSHGMELMILDRSQRYKKGYHPKLVRLFHGKTDQLFKKGRDHDQPHALRMQ